MDIIVVTGSSRRRLNADIHSVPMLHCNRSSPLRSVNTSSVRYPDELLWMCNRQPSPERSHSNSQFKTPSAMHVKCHTSLFSSNVRNAECATHHAMRYSRRNKCKQMPLHDHLTTVSTAHHRRVLSTHTIALILVSRYAHLIKGFRSSFATRSRH